MSNEASSAKGSRKRKYASRPNRLHRRSRQRLRTFKNVQKRRRRYRAAEDARIRRLADEMDATRPADESAEPTEEHVRACDAHARAVAHKRRREETTRRWENVPAAR